MDLDQLTGLLPTTASSAGDGDHTRSDIDEELQPAKLIVPEDLKGTLPEKPNPLGTQREASAQGQ